MYRRKIYDKLVERKNRSQGRTALLIEGARRVGKSTIAEEFGRREYRSFVMVDFMKPNKKVVAAIKNHPEDLTFFFNDLTFAYKVELHERNTLIVFDEVQRCPQTRELIKALVADGRYDYIETGSLVSIRLNVADITIPSEEEAIGMFPMDFEEFLLSTSTFDPDLIPAVTIKRDILNEARFFMPPKLRRRARGGGEFFTPQEASRLLALITTWGKKKVNKVYDPACGSGSLLMQVAKVLGKDKVLGGFFGQEKEPTIHQLCRMNMFLHDIDPRKIDNALGDTLIHPNERHLDAEPFEVVVSNPPYSIPWTGDSDPTLASDERFAPAGVLAPKKAADFAFILHALSWLAESGCAAIVCFPGIFYRKGAEQKIRQYLVDNNFVDAIIDLPANLFFGTSIATTILVLCKNKKNDNNVLFVSGCDEFVKEGNKNKLTDANIDAIFKLYTDRKTVKYKTRLVPYEEIAKNGFNLSVATYVDTTPPAPPKDLKAIGARVIAATKETDKCRAAVDKILKELT